MECEVRRGEERRGKKGRRDEGRKKERDRQKVGVEGGEAWD